MRAAVVTGPGQIRLDAIRRPEPGPGQVRIRLEGCGVCASILTRLATDAGARVIAISRRPFSLDVARAFGAAETIAMEDHNAVIETVKGLTDGVFCDRVIEAVGKQWPLDLAAELTRERGKLI